MVVPSTPLRRGVCAPHQCPLEVGSKLPLPLRVDAWFHIPMTHRNDSYHSPIYGADTPGSLTDADQVVWNVNKLVRTRRNLHAYS